MTMQNLERQSYGQHAPGYIRAYCRCCGWASHWYHQDDSRDMTTLQGVEAIHQCALATTEVRS